MNLYDNIKRLCDKAGITPSGLCVELGISKTIVSRLRNNPEALLSYATASKIADYFSVAPEMILEGEKENAKTDSLDDEIMDKVHRINENEETREMLDALMHRSDLRALLHMGKDATPEQIEGLVEMLRRFKGE